MSTSRFRYRGGDTNLIFAKYTTAHPIEEGDLCFLDPTSGYVRPAADMVGMPAASIVANQLAFAKYFIGVAMAKMGLQTGEKSFRLVTEGNCVPIATTGLFEFDCAGDLDLDDANAGMGSLVAIFAAASAVKGTAIPDSQKVAPTTVRSSTIGFLRPQPADYAQSNPGQTRCLVQIDAGYAKGGSGTVSSVAGTYTDSESGQ